MKFHTEYLTFHTQRHREYINITGEVNAALKKSAIREGMILVSAMHITAGVWVNDAEDGLLADIDEWLEKLAPYRDDYQHHRTGDTSATGRRRLCRGILPRCLSVEADINKHLNCSATLPCTEFKKEE